MSRPATRHPDLGFERTLTENGVGNLRDPLEILGSRGLTANILKCHVGVFRESDDLFVIQLRLTAQFIVFSKLNGLVR